MGTTKTFRDEYFALPVWRTHRCRALVLCRDIKSGVRCYAASGTPTQVQMCVGDGELVGASGSRVWTKRSLPTNLASALSLVCLYSRKGKNLDLHTTGWLIF